MQIYIYTLHFSKAGLIALGASILYEVILW